MKNNGLYPLKFEAIYKHYIWGGRNLEKIGKNIAPDEIVAESWEVSDHDEDISTAANGSLRGKTLRELIAAYGTDICPVTENGRFPILIKYIDASRKLSVQVHPDDSYARSHESSTELGKNECWYIMEAPPGAELILGIKKGMARNILKTLIEENRIEDGIQRHPVSKGDFIYIKSGTVHALLEDIMVCEIQQNSDTTYRMYDWGRMGANGKPRPLHIEKALDVINYLPEEEYERYMGELAIPYNKSTVNHTHALVREKFFNIDLLKYRIDADCSFHEEHFHTLNILDGNGTISWKDGDLPCQKGESILVPRAAGSYTIYTAGIEILKSFL